MGNTCLYGATGGELYANGQAGERFAVRNSGATAIVEGVGDNGCEYMTGGTVVVIGETGINFGAGMTGGLAYLYDPKDNAPINLNPEFTELAEVQHPKLQQQLKTLLQQHVNHTGSKKAQKILKDFDEKVTKFKLVKPQRVSIEQIVAGLTPAVQLTVNNENNIPVKEAS